MVVQGDDEEGEERVYCYWDYDDFRELVLEDARKTGVGGYHGGLPP